MSSQVSLDSQSPAAAAKQEAGKSELNGKEVADLNKDSDKCFITVKGIVMIALSILAGIAAAVALGFVLFAAGSGFMLSGGGILAAIMVTAVVGVAAGGTMAGIIEGLSRIRIVKKIPE